jgi:hypothetical protein
MHYVSTATSHATSTPPKNDPMPLEPPPHHLGLEDGWIHSSLGESMHVSSPKPKRNHEISTTFFPEDKEFFEATTSFNDSSDNLHLGSPIHYWQGPNNSIGAPSNIISLDKVITPSQIRSYLITDRDIRDSSSMMTNHAHIGDVSTQFKVPNPPIDITQNNGSDTLFQILFCGCSTLNCLLFYLWSIILGIWKQPFPQSSYDNTGGSTTSHLGPIRPSSRHNTNSQYTLHGNHYSTTLCPVPPDIM